MDYYEEEEEPLSPESCRIFISNKFIILFLAQFIYQRPDFTQNVPTEAAQHQIKSWDEKAEMVSRQEERGNGCFFDFINS